MNTDPITETERTRINRLIEGLRYSHPAMRSSLALLIRDGQREDVARLLADELADRAIEAMHADADTPFRARVAYNRRRLHGAIRAIGYTGREFGGIHA